MFARIHAFHSLRRTKKVGHLTKGDPVRLGTAPLKPKGGLSGPPAKIAGTLGVSETTETCANLSGLMMRCLFLGNF
jgi:hypothetical protein